MIFTKKYTEANSQRNTDFGVHFFVFIFIKIFFFAIVIHNKTQFTVSSLLFWINSAEKVSSNVRPIHLSFT